MTESDGASQLGTLVGNFMARYGQGFLDFPDVLGEILNEGKQLLDSKSATKEEVMAILKPMNQAIIRLFAAIDTYEIGWIGMEEEIDSLVELTI